MSVEEVRAVECGVGLRSTTGLHQHCLDARYNSNQSLVDEHAYLPSDFRQAEAINLQSGGSGLLCGYSKGQRGAVELYSGTRCSRGRDGVAVLCSCEREGPGEGISTFVQRQWPGLADALSRAARSLQYHCAGTGEIEEVWGGWWELHCDVSLWNASQSRNAKAGTNP